MVAVPENLPELPRVSVIIPCYNRERYVGQAVQSVLDQTWPNTELLVVDDGSTDGTRLVLESFGDQLRVLTHPGGANRGQSASINVGLANTRGAYVAILDSDDWWARDKLETHVRFLECHQDVGLVYGNGFRVDDRTGERSRFYPENHGEESDPAKVLLDCYFSLPGNSVFRREVLDKAGLFDESLRSGQDHDMAVRIAEVSKLAYLPGESFFYRRHDDSISHRNVQLRWRNGFRILKKAAARYPYAPDIIRRRRAVLHFRLGQALLMEGHYMAAAPCFARAFMNDPARSFAVLSGRERVSAPSA